MGADGKDEKMASKVSLKMSTIHNWKAHYNRLKEKHGFAPPPSAGCNGRNRPPPYTAIYILQKHATLQNYVSSRPTIYEQCLHSRVGNSRQSIWWKHQMEEISNLINYRTLTS
jgi:hypothetical protein